MLLLDLQPHWIHPNVFAFLCPHCKIDWLILKDKVFTQKEMYALYEKAFGSDWNMGVVPCKEDYAWEFSSRDFIDITVEASTDASKSGHWHGNIVKGQIVGGVILTTK